MILARRFTTGLVGKARALLHGLGPKGDHPSRVTLNRHGLYVQFVRPTEARRAIGFVFRWTGPWLYSERHGRGWKRSWRLGPLYLRGYARPDE